MSRLKFNARMFRAPERTDVGPGVTIDGVSYGTIVIDPRSLNIPFERTFEDVLFALQNMPRCHAEADGSFVWSPQEGIENWRVEGQLQDLRERLLFVHLHGACYFRHWQILRDHMAGKDERCVWELVQTGVVLDETEFLRQAAAIGEGGAD